MPTFARRSQRRTGVFVGILLTLLLIAPGLSSVSAAPSTPTAVRPPNIVFILTDDLDAESWKLFPQIQHLLVDQGTSFNNYFVTDSLCCPSRSSIFLGEYIHNHGVLGNDAPDGGFQQFLKLGHENSTFATWLQSAGYTTALMGKYLNQYPASANPTYVPPGYNEWDVPLNGGGYGEFNYQLNTNGQIVPYGHDPKDYLVDVMSTKGDQFITQAASAGKPFMIELATFAPHQPATPAPRYADAFPNAKAPRTASFNEADVSDKPAWVQSKPLMTDKTIASVDALYRKRLQSMLAVDDLVGNVVKTLQATGQLDNTYIVFSSDNGFHLGQHRLPMGKQTAYETDINVPLVIRGPGVAAGQTRSEIASNIDLAPTFAAWAGVTSPSNVDGRSLTPLLSATPPADWRTATLIEHMNSAKGKSDPDSENATINGASPPAVSANASPTANVKKAARKGTNATGKRAAKNKNKKKKGSGAGKAVPLYSAMRTDAYLYVEYRDGAQELYNIKVDPEELTNLAGAASPTLLAQLSSRLAQLSGCAGATCRTAEDASVPDISSVAPPPPAATPAG